MFIIFYWRLFTSIHGFLSFDNFTQRLNYGEITQLPVFYQPYSNFGSINSSPLGTLEYYFFDVILLLFPAHFFDLYIGTKIFIILSSTIFGISFYWFTSIFTRNIFSKIIGTAFFLFNPFMIQIYVSGDFQPILFQSFIFIGSTLLYIALRSKRYFHPFFLLSSFFLILSFEFLALVILGTLFFIIIFIYFALFENFEQRSTNKWTYVLGSFIIFSCCFIATSLIVALPLLGGPVSYLPGSVSSLPLSTFLGGAQNLFNVLTLKAYPPYLSWIIVKNQYGATAYYIWNGLEIILMLVFILSYAFYRDKRLLFFTVLSLAVIAIAAETSGPFGTLSVYLYETFPGYQAINYPYLWLWLSLVPLYGIILTILMSNLFCERSNCNSQFMNESSKINESKSKAFPFRIYLKSHVRRIARWGMLILVVTVIAIPVSSQGYYGNNGIHDVPLPKWFNNLDNKLINLTSKNESGVLFNTINEYFNFGNDTNNGLGNLLQYYPQFKTVSLSSYIPNYNSVTNFFYWFYYMLYTNGTRYSAELSSMIGVQYFVDIYNANSEGYPYFVPWSYNINASMILSEQPGWSLINSTTNYAIFRNNLFNGIDYYTHNVSIVLGGYDTLNYMAYLGVNLSTLSPLFGSQISNGFNYSTLLNYSNLIVLNGNNSLYDLILGLSNSISLYPVDYINGVDGNDKTNWINSERNNNYPYYSTNTPFAETDGANNLTISVSMTHPGTYNIFLHTLFSNNSSLGIQGGVFRLLLNNQLLGIINTSRSYDGETNTFLWINFTGNFNFGKNTITLQSTSGFNAVSQINILDNHSLISAEDRTNQLLQKNKDNLIEVFPVYQIASSSNGSYYGNKEISSLPAGQYAYLSANSTASKLTFGSIFPFNGNLVVSALVPEELSMNISYNKEYFYNTVSPGTHEPISQIPAGYVTYQVENLTNASLSITSGNGYFGLLALIPKNYIPQKVIPNYTSLGTLTSENLTRSITNFTITEGGGLTYSYIDASFSFSNVSEKYPLTLMFSNKFYYNLSPLFLVNFTGPREAQILLNGISMQTNNFLLGTVSPTLNTQNFNRPKNIVIEFNPALSNVQRTQYVHFNLTFFGFSKYPSFQSFHRSDNSPGPILNYTYTNFSFHSNKSGVLVVRSPVFSGSSSYQIYSTLGNLNFVFILTQNYSNVRITYSSYSLFVYGAEIYASFSISFVLIPPLISFLKRKRGSDNS